MSMGEEQYNESCVELVDRMVELANKQEEAGDQPGLQLEHTLEQEAELGRMFLEWRQNLP